MIHICIMTQMSVISLPRQLSGPSPRLSTIHEVESILREAAAHDEGPLSLAEIKRRMHANSVRHSTVRACIEEFKRFHLVTEDPRRGVMWTLHENLKFWRTKGIQRL